LFGVWLSVLGVGGGVAGTALIIIINQVIRLDPHNAHFYAFLFLVYAVMIVLYFGMQKVYQSLLIRISQKLIWEIRLSILDNIRRAALDRFQRIEISEVYSVLTTDAANISFISNALATMITSGVTVVLCLAYLAWLTFAGFLITLLVMVLIVAIYFIRQQSIMKQLHKARDKEEEFFKYLQHLLYGIKEVKMDSRRNDDLYWNYLKRTASDAESLKVRSNISFMDNSLLGQLYFFVVLGAFLFVFPAFNIHLLSNTPQYILVTLYLMAPGQTIAQLVPYFSLANIGIDRFQRIKQKISGTGETIQAPGSFDGQHFRKVSFNNISYSYYKEEGDPEANFSIGPLNLEINRGEVLFISGPNGSGKSTFVRLITGLYTPSVGEIHVDHVKITEGYFQDYRNMFIPVYTDNYLFDRIYGYPAIDPEYVNGYLREMGIFSKVQFENDRYSTIDLSEGQKKRVGLVSALVEDKPIFVFDELAANQDPGFKHYFYHTLVPSLKEKGKTVIVITHDDRYFHLADRHYIMENGLIRN